jgi:hypothetical protein
MKETFYFSHDFNARNDEKIKRLLMRHGVTGYGIYWAIIEDLYMNANALRTECERIAYELRVDAKVVESVIFDFDLFVFDDENFGSLSVQRRLDERFEKSAKARESANKRWNNANALQTQSDRNAIKESKVKEIKVKENKNIYKDSLNPLLIFIFENCPNIQKMNQPMTEIEANKLMDAFQFQEIAEILISMDNYKKLNTSYQSPFKTCLNWLKRAKNDKTNNNKPTKVDWTDAIRKW